MISYIQNIFSIILLLDLEDIKNKYSIIFSTLCFLSYYLYLYISLDCGYLYVIVKNTQMYFSVPFIESKFRQSSQHRGL